MLKKVHFNQLTFSEASTGVSRRSKIFTLSTLTAHIMIRKSASAQEGHSRQPAFPQIHRRLQNDEKSTFRSSKKRVEMFLIISKTCIRVKRTSCGAEMIKHFIQGTLRVRSPSGKVQIQVIMSNQYHLRIISNTKTIKNFIWVTLWWSGKRVRIFTSVTTTIIHRLTRFILIEYLPKHHIYNQFPLQDPSWQFTKSLKTELFQIGSLFKQLRKTL